MATGRDDLGDWTTRSLIRRDFRQDHGGGPEVPKHNAKRKMKRWCKKEGRLHDWEFKVAWTFEWTDHEGKRQHREYRRWICNRCGKMEYGDPRWKDKPKHEHKYTITIHDDQDHLYEKCETCGKLGEYMVCEHD